METTAVAVGSGLNEGVTPICNGTGLQWPDLDEDLSVLGILDERFGLP